jgi:cell division protein FtsZ
MINIDFADVKTIMKGHGDALMGIGVGNGENRAVDAATNAINNPLLEDTRIDGAKGLLVNVSGGSDFSLSEYEEVLNIITANADEDALIIAGSAVDELMEHEVTVSVIATGFNQPELERPAEEHQEQKKEEVFSLDEWIEMTTGRGRRDSNGTKSEDVEDDELGIPAVLRMRSGRRSGSGE